MSATGSALGGIVGQPASDGITIVRLRGEFLFRLRTASAPGSGFHGAIGIGIFTDAAVAVGVSALNTPITDETWDGWMWHRYFACHAEDAIAAAGASNEPNQGLSTFGTVRVEMDSKAMRKIPVGMSLSVVIEVIEVTVATAIWQFNSRSLVKLPSVGLEEVSTDSRLGRWPTGRYSRRREPRG